jgi:hypothetical protein
VMGCRGTIVPSMPARAFEDARVTARDDRHCSSVESGV